MRSEFLKLKPKVYSKGVLEGNYAYEQLADQPKNLKKDSQRFVTENQR